MEAAAALADWLRDDAIGVEERVGVIESLPERLAMFELGKVLVPVIDSASPLALRAPAVRAFATTGNVNVLVRLPSRPDPEMRRLVVDALDEIARRPRSSSARWDQHMAQIHSEDHEQTALALTNMALVFGRDREAIAVLAERLRDDDPRSRRAAAFGLGLLSELRPLIELCASGAESDSEVRRTVARGIGLGFTGGKGEIQALRLLVEDADPQEARKALRALGLLPRPTRKTTTRVPSRSKAPWSTLLGRLNDLWLNDDSYLLDVPDEVVEQGWLGYPPASSDLIAATETRLGVRLPPSYREFLGVSNGWRRVAPEAGGLLPVESVDWFANHHQDWIDAYADTKEHTGLQRAILLSEGTQAVILLATAIPGAPGECQAWYFANWIPGAETFPSFEHLITWASQPRWRNGRAVEM